MKTTHGGRIKDRKYKLQRHVKNHNTIEEFQFTVKKKKIKEVKTY